MSIRLDPEHGVNPSLLQCFYCMGDKGLALLGHLNARQRAAFVEEGLKDKYDDPGAAPRKLCLDMEPCDKCRGYMDMGVILVSTSNETVDTKNPFRTGGFVVLKDEAIRRMLSEELANTIIERRFAFVPDEAWDQIGLPRSAVDGVPSE